MKNMQIFVIFVAVLFSAKAATVPPNVIHKVTVPLPGNVLAGGVNGDVEVPAVVVEVSKDHKHQHAVAMEKLVEVGVTTEEGSAESSDVTTVQSSPVSNITLQVSTIVPNVEEMITVTVMAEPATEVSGTTEATTSEAEITTIHGKEIITDITTVDSVTEVPQTANEAEITTVSVTEEGKQKEIPNSAVAAMEDSKDSKESSDEETQNPSTTTKVPNESEESSEDHSHNASTESSEVYSHSSSSESTKSSAMKYRMKEGEESSEEDAHHLSTTTKDPNESEESSEEHSHNSPSESVKSFANKDSEEGKESAKDHSHNPPSEQDVSSVTTISSQQKNAKILESILPPILTPVLQPVIKQVLPPIVDDLLSSKPIQSPTPSKEVSEQTKPIVIKVPLITDTFLTRSRRAVPVNDQKVMISPTSPPKLTTDPSIIAKILAKSKGLKTRPKRSVESTTIVAATEIPLADKIDVKEEKMPATLDPCDLLCTKFEFEPICASNGLCLFEFSNQCILDTFNCKHPNNKFAATKDDRCQMHWLDFCSESEML